MTNPEPACSTVRDLLLDHVYGALEPDESAGVERHLRDCAACRDDLAAARGQRDVLAEAARAEASDVTFVTPRARPRILRPVGWAAVAATLVGGAVALGHVGGARARMVSKLPIVEISGPRTVLAGVPAEYRVTARTADGSPVPAIVRASVADAKGVMHDVGIVTLNATAGEGLFTFDAGRINAMPEHDGPMPPPLALAPGATTRLTVRAEFPGGASAVGASLRVHEGTRLVSRVSTDKPLYRPGETVRVRAVALEGFRLTPPGDVPMRMKIFDPRGGLVVDRTIPSQAGVTAWPHELAADAPGGTYKVELTGAGDGPSVAKSEREFRVRAFRAPRLRFDTELDRDSYRPGAGGTALLKVLRAEGGAPAGAKAECVLRVDGNEASRATLTVAADGGLVVPFQIPPVVEEGRASLSVTVSDGGAVETTAKTIPLTLDIVRFEAFPEGGALVAGLPNRIYFRARTPADEPADLDAEVRDRSNRTVATVRTDVLGMGAFDLTPVAGENYRVVFAKTGLPVCEGATLTAERAGVTLRALDETVSASRPLAVRVGSTKGGTYTVGAWCRGVPVGETTVDVAPGASADASIRLRSDVGGVFRVTVFEGGGTPVAERLVAREPARRLGVTVTPSRPKSAPREPMKVGVRVVDENGKPAQTILGVSVVDASVLALADDRDAASLPLHFLLGMEVKDLEEVDTFAPGAKAALATDRLLGVQGWRRFAWRDAKAFVAANPQDAARVAGVGADDTPNRWTNASSVNAAVASAARSAKREAGGAAVSVAFVGLLLAGVYVGVRGLTSKARWYAVGGFGASGLLALIVAIAAVVSKSESVELKMIRGAAADAGPVPTAAAGPPMPAKLGRGAAAVDVAAEAVAHLEEEAALADGAARLGDLEKNLRRDGGLQLDAKDVDRFLADDLVAGAGGGAELLDGDVDGRVVGLAGPGTPGGGGGPSAEEGKKRAEEIAQFLVREYAHKAQPAADGARSDFTDVLYWSPLLLTDANGEASFAFATSDSVTAFHVAVEGYDGRGALGAGDAEFSNRIPFYAEPKFPQALTAGDEVDLPVVVANDGDRTLDVAASVRITGDLLASRDGIASATIPVARGTRDTIASNVVVGAGARGRVLVPMIANQGRGSVTLDIDARAGANLVDHSRRTISVFPRGFPIAVNESGVLEKVDSTTILLPDRLNKVTLTGALRLYPSMLATLVDGLDGMLREPGGCFEQASSSNYPNVMVLNYLQEQGTAAPDVARRAKDLLGRGYKLLTGYECKRKGYEWFGGDPGHEALTAYGLMEFADMGKVFDVDAAMVARTRDWLMTRRDGKGGFLRDPKALDSFGRASQEITDAYVTWALTEADATSDVTAELDAVEKRGRESDDPYVVALAANALKLRNWPAAGTVLGRLASMQRKDGGFSGKTMSITSSNGINLDVETTSLAILAFSKDPARLANAESGVRFLLANRRGGSFGATQATILALRALTAHAKASKRTASDHDITVLVNGEVVGHEIVPAGTPGVIEIGERLLAALRPGENRVELRTTGAEALPWAVQLEYSTDLPASDPACVVGVATSLDRAEAREGETVDLSVVVTNRSDVGQAMTLARVGVPAGLEPRAERLEELKKSGAIDFFELRPLEVVLYWRGLAPKAERRVAIELTASIPGRFEGPASSAYLYYGDDKKTWAAPLRCAVGAVR